MAAGLNTREGNIKKERTRKQKQILEAAARLFLSKGFAKTSIREIVDETGVSRETVYTNFENKAGLFAAVIDDMLGTIHQPISELDIENLGLREGLLSAARQSMSLLLRDESVSMARLAFSESEDHPDVGQLYFEHAPMEGFKRLAGFLKKHQERANFPAGDAQQAAEYFWGMLLYKIKMERYCGTRPLPSQAEIESICERVVDDYLYFYRVR